MELVLVFLGQIIAQGLGVVTGIFAAGLSDAVRWGPQVRARAAQILVEGMGQFIKNTTCKGTDTEKSIDLIQSRRALNIRRELGANPV